MAADTAERLPWKVVRGTVVLAVRLTPRSSDDRVEGIEVRGGAAALKARVRAVPENGAANDALERLVASWLGLPKRDVALTGGGKSRDKCLSIAGDAGAIERVLAARLAEIGTVTSRKNE